MKLYHGSNVEINQIDFSKCRPNKDFGRGFYATTIKEQAIKMARRVARIYGGTPVVTVYDFDEKVLDDNSVCKRIFEKPNKEWAMFVINNRNRSFDNFKDRECNLDNKYDLVIGPIANDDLALLFRQFSNGLIDVNTLVKEMEFKQLTNQYSFHTEQALKYLKKVGVLNE